jgi:hypothetical protein
VIALSSDHWSESQCHATPSEITVRLGEGNIPSLIIHLSYYRFPEDSCCGRHSGDGSRGGHATLVLILYCGDFALSCDCHLLAVMLPVKEWNYACPSGHRCPRITQVGDVLRERA